MHHVLHRNYKGETLNVDLRLFVQYVFRIFYKNLKQLMLVLEILRILLIIFIIKNLYEELGKADSLGAVL